LQAQRLHLSREAALVWLAGVELAAALFGLACGLTADAVQKFIEERALRRYTTHNF